MNFVDPSDCAVRIRWLGALRSILDYVGWVKHRLLCQSRQCLYRIRRTSFTQWAYTSKFLNESMKLRYSGYFTFWRLEFSKH
jgi:hypothetical protein